jgi:hypothetical protein
MIYTLSSTTRHQMSRKSTAGVKWEAESSGTLPATDFGSREEPGWGRRGSRAVMKAFPTLARAALQPDAKIYWR